MSGGQLQIGGLTMLVVALCVAPAPGRSQTLIEPPALLLPSDLAVLIDSERRDDLPCRLSPVNPQIGFDLKFHTGYVATVPLKELSGNGNQLRIVMRVQPLGGPETEYHMADRFSVPPLDPDLGGEAAVPGMFVLGPGRYKVDWLMRDWAGRVCSAHWELEAKPADWLEGETPVISPNTVAERPENPFNQPPPVERAGGDRELHVKLLVNFSPSAADETTLKDWDLQAIVAILRGVAREPRFGRFSLVAFSMREERVFFRQDGVPSIDFPALGEAVDGLEFGTIDYERLVDPLSEARFLSGLFAEGAQERESTPDAIIIIGPKVMLEKKIPEQSLRAAGHPGQPIFYLNYNSNPRRNPWRDAIGAALRVYRGLEYAITAPRDLASALADMMSRLGDPEWRNGFRPSEQ